MTKSDYSVPADNATVAKVIKALQQNGIEAEVVDGLEQAKARVEELIPKGAQAFTSTSKTLEAAGITELINNSGDFDSVRNQLNELMGQEGDEVDKKRKILGAVPDYILGSVHAVTEEGEILVASGTGSQLAGYAYSARHVIWLIGTQKIVKDMAEAMDRLQTYTWPLEDKRLKEAHGPDAHSVIRKLLIINKESKAGRIRAIFINQNIGF